MKGKIYIIGIGGIGISAIARYYNENGYQVFGSDKTESELTKNLQKEGIDVYIGERPDFISNDFEKVIYTEAIPNKQKELIKAKNLNIETETYPKAISEIAKNKIFITIAGTHGKSTTTSLTSLIFKNSDKNFTSIVGTLLNEFNGKNFFSRKNNKKEDYFVIEACEYKRSFLNYKPNILVITNIEVDHLDYYKDEKDYISAFVELLNNLEKGGIVILNGNDKNSEKLVRQNKDVQYVIVYNNYFIFQGKKYIFPHIKLRIPGEHIIFDAKLSYALGVIIGIDETSILKTLHNYNGAWRRMEIVQTTKNNNILLSDYGHHPTEIKLTLKALRDKYPDKYILLVFQPHQFNRTLNLLDDFSNSFSDANEIIIPDIYESRDSKEDKEKINTEIFLEKINHKNKQNGNGLKNTLKLIKDFDKKNNNSLIVLMGAGDVDNLRYESITE